MISIVILVSTWSLLAKSFRLTLDGVPHGINTEKIISVIEKTKGVQNLHHLHLWAISTRENALTAHIVADDLNNMEQIKKEIKNQLSTEGITHITLEFETEGVACKDKSIIAQD